MFLTRAERRWSRPDRRRAAAGFTALVDALDSGIDVDAACQEIGRRAAAEGQSIDDLLEGLAVTYEHRAAGTTPPFDVVRRLTSAWADASLSYLHAMSCEDPMTGLASLAHVRSRLSDVYRASASLGIRDAPPYALLVVEIDWAQHAPAHLDKVMRMLDVSELVRAVYAGDEIIGQLTGTRIVAVVRRHDEMGDAVKGLLGLLSDWERRSALTARLWLEGLPASMDSAGLLLDELAR